MLGMALATIVCFSTAVPAVTIGSTCTVRPDTGETVCFLMDCRLPLPSDALMFHDWSAKTCQWLAEDPNAP